MNYRILVMCLLLFVCSQAAALGMEKQDFFQLRIYHYETARQEQLIDDYLQQAYIPALHKLGFSQVGVFKPIDRTNRTIYVFLSASDLRAFATLDTRLNNEPDYLRAGKAYLEAPYDDPAYLRIETILLQAFEGMPKAGTPELTAPRNERVYELRSYEGASEKLSGNKIHMFNHGEIEIFKKLGFNAVFYGQVISGSTMPNLMYLTTFNSMADRDEHWEAFWPLYQPMRDMPKYQNNVSKNVTLLLYPTEYADF